MNPEFFEYISEKLFKAGASDVFFTNIMMKKGRPGIVLNVICETEMQILLKILFSQNLPHWGSEHFPSEKILWSENLKLLRQFMVM